VKALLVAAALAGTAGLAHADFGPSESEGDAAPGAVVADLQLEASLDARTGLKRSVGYHLTEKATLWSNELGTHLNMLTMDLVDLNFDVRKRRANVRVGALTDSGGLRIDGRIKVRSNVARIQSSLALGLRGQTYQIDLPVFEVVTQDVGGERSVELRLPIIYGHF